MYMESLCKSDQIMCQSSLESDLQISERITKLSYSISNLEYPCRTVLMNESTAHHQQINSILAPSPKKGGVHYQAPGRFVLGF